MRSVCTMKPAFAALQRVSLGTPVVEAIGAEEKSRFIGHIPKVTVQVQ
jgi:hypothetical protein